MTTAEQAFASRTLGQSVLRAALEGRASDLLALLVTEHDGDSARPNVCLQVGGAGV